MIRLSGQGHAFRHDGLILESNWTSFDALTDKQRATLRDYHGTHVRVHPHDYDALAELGLRFQADAAGNLHMHKPLVDTLKTKGGKPDKKEG